MEARSYIQYHFHRSLAQKQSTRKKRLRRMGDAAGYRTDKVNQPEVCQGRVYQGVCVWRDYWDVEGYFARGCAIRR